MGIWLLLNIVLFVSLILILWIRKRKKRFSIFKDHGIPGPEPNFWFGNFNDFIQKREECISEYSEKYGQVFGCFLGAKPLLVVVDPHLVKTLQIKEFKSFTNRDVLLPDAGVPHPDVSFSIVVIKDDEWKRVRTISTPSFSTSKLRKIVPTISDAINLFLGNIIEKSKNGEGFDIAPLYRNLSLDISTKSEFGINSGIQHGENKLFLESALGLLDTDSTDILAGLSICFPETEPVPTMLRSILDKSMYLLGRKSANIMFNMLQDIINQRRNYNERREDILQNLMDAKIHADKLSSIQDTDLTASYDYQQKEQTQEDSGTYLNSVNSRYVSLSDETIRASTLSFLVAGFETTSATLSFSTYYLAKYQDIQEKVREEIHANIKGEYVQYEDIFNLQYLDQVISETLRLHSLSMFATSRIASKTYRYKELIIPKGISVVFPSFLLHRNPDHWPDPEKFDPDRFSPENKAKIDPAIYQPFGNGPRNCIGMRLAQIILKFTLVRLLRSYKLEKASDRDMELKFSIFLSRPKEVMVKAIPI